MKTRILLLLLVLVALVAFVLPAQAADRVAVFTIGSPEYTVNNQPFAMDISPYVENGRTYVPVRFLAYALGVQESGPPEPVLWFPDTKEVLIYAPPGSSTKYVQLWVGQNVLLINYPDYTVTKVTMDVTPVVVNGRVMLPARWVAEAFGATVNWNPVNQQVTVSLSVPDSNTVTPPATTSTPVTITTTLSLGTVHIQYISGPEWWTRTDPMSSPLSSEEGVAVHWDSVPGAWYYSISLSPYRYGIPAETVTERITKAPGIPFQSLHYYIYEGSSCCFFSYTKYPSLRGATKFRCEITAYDQQNQVIATGVADLQLGEFNYPKGSEVSSTTYINPPVQIIGSPHYQEVIRQALTLLYSKDPTNYELVCGHLVRIEEYQHSGVDVRKRIFYNRLNPYSEEYLPYWEAAEIVHEANHVWLYRNNYQWFGEKAEIYCCNAQKDCLERLRAPDWMVESVRNSPSTNYWDVPFEKRPW
jgi:hypothetical protein